MKLFLVHLLLGLSAWTFAQDGSDIRYLKVSAVDSSLLGQFVHLDFFNHSSGGRHIDTVSIRIDKKSIRFVEVRKDNGFNNWFYRQYLQSAEKVNGEIVRIPQFKLDGVTPTSFNVTMFVDFFDDNDKLISEKSKQYHYSFDKKDIVEVLVKSKQL